MRKFIVLIALALAALAPSSAAFADTGRTDAREAQPWMAVSDARPGVPSGERWIMGGCFNGKVWQATINSTGAIFGKFTGQSCEGNDFVTMWI